MPTEFSIEKISDYFNKLNPIAAKIALDIDETKSTYEHIWEELNAHEHNEIINETLMNPEISLKYFDNFSIVTSASSLSMSSIVTPNQTEDSSSKFSRQPTHPHNLAIRRFYEYDGRNLSTYADQKVGLKVIHDETLGTFRDVYSMPFSYKTKSQINLKLFLDEEANKSPQYKGRNREMYSKSTEVKDIKLSAAGDTLQIPAETFQKLHTELASNISNRNKVGVMSGTHHEHKPIDKVNGKYQRFYNEPMVLAEPAPCHRTPNNIELNLLKMISKNGKSVVTKMQQSKYGYDLNTANDEEQVKLMMNCCSQSSGGMRTSSSSAPSEDDEKLLCEDLKLLLDNDGLRRGFDFLNNW